MALTSTNWSLKISKYLKDCSTEGSTAVRADCARKELGIRTRRGKAVRNTQIWLNLTVQRRQPPTGHRHSLGIKNQPIWILWLQSERRPPSCRKILRILFNLSPIEDQERARPCVKLILKLQSARNSSRATRTSRSARPTRRAQLRAKWESFIRKSTSRGPVTNLSHTSSPRPLPVGFLASGRSKPLISSLGSTKNWLTSKATKIINLRSASAQNVSAKLTLTNCPDIHRFLKEASTVGVKRVWVWSNLYRN